MKIALVHRKFTRAGGVEKNVVLLATGLASRGHEIHVYCNQVEGDVPNGVTIHRVPVLRLGTAAKYLSFARNARAALEKDRFDIVQGFDLTTRQDVLRVGRGLVKVYRSLLEETRNPIDKLWRRFSPGSLATASLERRMLERGAWKRIVAISRVVSRELVENYAIPAESIEVIYNGVDLVSLSPEKALAGRASIRASFGFADSDRVVLFVGTGFRRKGLDTLLEAFRRLAAGEPRAKLLVVGRDGRTAAYRAQAVKAGIASRVVFAGRRKADAGLFGAADALALPTRYEPFGNVVLEALACGVPTIVSAAAGASEVLEEDLRDLVLPDAGDAAKLAEILGETLAQPPGPLAVACRRVAERYSEEACVARYEAIYKRILQRRGESGAHEGTRF